MGFPTAPARETKVALGVKRLRLQPTCSRTKAAKHVKSRPGPQFLLKPRGEGTAQRPNHQNKALIPLIS